MKVKEKMIGGVAMTQNLTYTRCGDYLIPDVRLSYVSDKPLGKYGRMRRVFLAENNPIQRRCDGILSGSGQCNELETLR